MGQRFESGQMTKVSAVATMVAVGSPSDLLDHVSFQELVSTVQSAGWHRSWSAFFDVVQNGLDETLPRVSQQRVATAASQTYDYMLK